MAIDPHALDHTALAEALLGAVLEAGRIELRHYAGDVVVETKADASPVTAADREAEVVLVAAIEAAAPGIPIIAEEAAAAGHLPDGGDVFFLVDPLDGTREFINRNGEFTVNIALVVAGVPVFGIVYAPVLGDLYATLGAARSAAARFDAQSRLTRLDQAPWRDIHTRPGDPNHIVAVASRSHMSAEGEAWLARLPIASRRNAGSSLKFCLLANGEADVYPRHGPTMEWDTAAGDAVLRAAGGMVTTLDGEPLAYGKRQQGLRNPSFVAWGNRRPLILG
jgi:3'(2'), 5'-bisphosphate nucleotidase